MRALALLAFGLALLCGSAFGQNGGADPPVGRLYPVAVKVPIVEGRARDYQKFFDEAKMLGLRPVSAKARAKLDLSNEELRSLMAITGDLVDESLFFERVWRPWKLESLMESIERGGVASQAMQDKMRDLRDQWAQVILEHVRRLKSAFGEARFGVLDEFVRSGEDLFGTGNQ